MRASGLGKMGEGLKVQTREFTFIKPDYGEAF